MMVKLISVYGHELDEEIEVFPFTQENIDAIPDDVLCGNYRIGLIVRNNHFRVRYYGRSDSNQMTLQQRIRDHHGETTNRENRIYDDSYYFWYEAANDSIEAYYQECRDFHSFGTHDIDDFVDNEIHPDTPAGMGHLKCPIPHV